MPTQQQDAPDPADYTAPPNVPHYENGPVTMRNIEFRGRLWELIYRADFDGIGWRVKSCEVRSLEESAGVLQPGDLVDLRLKVAKDFGTEVQLMIERPQRQFFWALRSSIVRIIRTVGQGGA